MAPTQSQTQKIVVVRNVNNVFGLNSTPRFGDPLLVERGRNPVSVSESELRTITAGRQVSEIDAKGGVLLPGYHNLHAHTSQALMRFFNPIYSIFGKTSKKEVLEALRADVPSRREKGLIVAYGLNTTKVRDLTKDDLDAVCSDVPMIVFDPSYHGAVANTKALSLLARKAEEKVKETKLPLVGECNKNGLLTEDHVFLGFALMDDYFGKDMYAAANNQSIAILTWLKEQVKTGMVCMHDMAFFTPTHVLAVLLAAKQWEQDMGIPFPIEKINIRPEVFAALLNNREKYSAVLTELTPWIEAGRVGVKLLADGSFGSYTALLSQRYADVDTCGTSFDSEGRALGTILRVAELGITDVRIHAIGDQGIRDALAILAGARRALGSKAYLGIEHFELSEYPDILSRAADLGIVACMQPNFGSDIGDYSGRLGDRVWKINPIMDILERGIPMTAGDDHMPSSGLGVLHDFTHHPAAHQRVDLGTAVEVYSRTHQLTRTSDIVDGLIVVTSDVFHRLFSDGKSEGDIRKEMGNIWAAAEELNRGVTHVIMSGMLIS